MAWESCPNVLPASYIRPSLAIASFSLLQIDFLSSLILSPELPSLGVVTISVSRRDGDSFQSQRRALGGLAQPDRFLPDPSSAVARGGGRAVQVAVRAHCSSPGCEERGQEEC